MDKFDIMVLFKAYVLADSALMSDRVKEKLSYEEAVNTVIRVADDILATYRFTDSFDVVLVPWTGIKVSPEDLVIVKRFDLNEISENQSNVRELYG